MCSTTHSLQIPRHHTWKTNVSSLGINTESSASLHSAGLSHALSPQPPCLLSPGGCPSGEPQTVSSFCTNRKPALPPTRPLPSQWQSPRSSHCPEPHKVSLEVPSPMTRSLSISLCWLRSERALGEQGERTVYRVQGALLTETLPLQLIHWTILLVTSFLNIKSSPFDRRLLSLSSTTLILIDVYMQINLFCIIKKEKN